MTYSKPELIKKIYNTLLVKADELLDYWQEQLLTDDRPDWVEEEIQLVKLLIQDTYEELEKLR